MNTYEKRLYRQGYRMPESCVNAVALSACPPEVHIFQRVQLYQGPFRHRELYFWRINNHGISEVGYLTANGAIKSGIQALAVMEPPIDF